MNLMNRRSFLGLGFNLPALFRQHKREDVPWSELKATAKHGPDGWKVVTLWTKSNVEIPWKDGRSS